MFHFSMFVRLIVIVRLKSIWWFYRQFYRSSFIVQFFSIANFKKKLIFIKNVYKYTKTATDSKKKKFFLHFEKKKIFKKIQTIFHHHRRSHYYCMLFCSCLPSWFPIELDFLCMRVCTIYSPEAICKYKFFTIRFLKIFNGKCVKFSRRSATVNW